MILEKSPILTLPTNCHQLSWYLELYAGDWEEVTNFIANICNDNGIEFDKEKVKEIMNERYSE